MNQYQRTILEVLDKNGSLNYNEAWRQSKLPKAIYNNMLKDLVQSSLISRSNDPEDKRLVLLSITDLGKEALKEKLDSSVQDQPASSDPSGDEVTQLVQNEPSIIEPTSSSQAQATHEPVEEPRLVNDQGQIKTLLKNFEKRFPFCCEKCGIVYFLQVEYNEGMRRPWVVKSEAITRVEPTARPA